MGRSMNGYTSSSLRYSGRGIEAYVLSSRRIQTLSKGRISAAACTSRRCAHRVPTGCRSAHTSSLFISTEWVIVRNNTTIWPRPIRDLNDVTFPPSPVTLLRSKRAALPPSILLFLYGSPTLHRFNGDPCRDPTSRACMRACTHPYTRAHVAQRRRVYLPRRPFRESDAILSSVRPPRLPRRESLIQCEEKYGRGQSRNEGEAGRTRRAFCSRANCGCVPRE